MVIKPILVCMVWRGGERFERCLRSIIDSQEHFARVLVSITGEQESGDMRVALDAQRANPRIEVICTGEEWPTMRHQAFWVDHLIATGVKASDWVYWLAYDDEVRTRGIEAILAASGEWPLSKRTAYFGPWAVRHEQPNVLWGGYPSEPIESWTSFPSDGPTRLPVAHWFAEQLRQPTYMQMSGSVNPLHSFTVLKHRRPRKRRPMRIEMATAVCPDTNWIEKFSEPVVTVYGRPDSDRSHYGRLAHLDGLDLAVRAVRYSVHHPAVIPRLGAAISIAGARAVVDLARRPNATREEWRVRKIVEP